MIQDDPQYAPRGTQEGSQEDQNSAKMLPEGPQGPQGGPKSAQRVAQRRPTSKKSASRPPF